MDAETALVRLARRGSVCAGPSSSTGSRVDAPFQTRMARRRRALKRPCTRDGGRRTQRGPSPCDRFGHPVPQNAPSGS